MNAARRLETMEDALDRLRQAAAGNVVVVEGRKDVEALKSLGVGGEHVVVHQGRTLQDVADRLADEAAGRRVILLVDWDRTGGRLARRLAETLAARTVLDVDLRRRLALSSREKCMEDIPAELAALRAKVGSGRLSNKG